METKKNERTKLISDYNELTEIAGSEYRYLAKNALKEWTEDFLDEATGEVVSVKRTEILFNRGRVLDHDTISQILFFMQTGELKQIIVSNQCREGGACVGSKKDIWTVTAAVSKKKFKLLMHAISATRAIETAIDYMELKSQNTFEIQTVKKFSDCIILEEQCTLKPIDEPGDDSDDISTFELTNYYKIRAKVQYDNGTAEGDFIVKAEDIDTAKLSISQYIEQNKDQEDPKDFTLTILSGDVISCNVIIPEEFCEAYYEI